MDERIYQIAERIVEIYQKAYEVYLPLVEDVCSRTVSEAELSHLLDYLLDFACDEKILKLYKKVCRKYLYVYPRCITFYIETYREMWEDEKECLENDLQIKKRISVLRDILYGLINDARIGECVWRKL